MSTADGLGSLVEAGKWPPSSSESPRFSSPNVMFSLLAPSSSSAWVVGVPLLASISWECRVAPMQILAYACMSGRRLRYMATAGRRRGALCPSAADTDASSASLSACGEGALVNLRGHLKTAMLCVDPPITGDQQAGVVASFQPVIIPPDGRWHRHVDARTQSQRCHAEHWTAGVST